MREQFPLIQTLPIDAALHSQTPQEASELCINMGITAEREIKFQHFGE